MNPFDLLKQEADLMGKQIAASYSGKSPWVELASAMSRRYMIREMFTSTMGSGLGKRPLYTLLDTGAKFIFGEEQVKPDKPGELVYGIWDRDEKKLLSVWPNKKLAEGVLRLMQ